MSDGEEWLAANGVPFEFEVRKLAALIQIPDEYLNEPEPRPLTRVQRLGIAWHTFRLRLGQRVGQLIAGDRLYTDDEMD